MAVTLWHIELSHFNEKVRWALDFKGVRHRRRAPMPGLHGAYAAVLTRSGHRRLPVLDLEGRRIGDSTAIIAALEERFPGPPLYPSEPADRDRALELEDFFDEQLAPALRSFIWHHMLGDPEAVVEAVLPTASPGRRRFLRTMWPAVAPIVRLDYRAKAGTADLARADVLAAMDRLEAELLPSGYLVGDRFGVADLTAAALFTPVLCPPGRQYPPAGLVPEALRLREELEARPGGAWVAEMFARHRGASAEIARSG